MAAGKKTGGRVKGTPNTKTAERKAEIAAGGELPLDYMLRVMRDPTVEHARRDDMAKASAKFVHPALAAIDSTVKHDVADPLAKLMERIATHGRRIHDKP